MATQDALEHYVRSVLDAEMAWLSFGPASLQYPYLEDLGLRFCVRSDQLRYGLSFDDVSAGIRARRLSYEGLLNLGNGEWDFVTVDNLSESVLLLADLVQRLVTIPQKLGSQQLV